MAELQLESPITEEQWDMLMDVDFDNTPYIEFHTKHGKTVRFVKDINVPDKNVGKMMLTADGGIGNNRFDELMKRIITAKDELFKRGIDANTVILNGQKYSVLVKDGYRPSIFGMAVETEFLPVEWDFIVQQKIEPQQPPTNADRIRGMSDEELAEWLEEHCFQYGWLDWLKQETSE